MRKILIGATALAVAAGLSALFLFGGDAAEIRKAQARIAYVVTDADSTKFRNEHVAWLDDGRAIVCGEVNAKNAFGGYVGFRNYHFMTQNGEDYLFVVGSGMLAPASAANGPQPAEMMLKCP